MINLRGESLLFGYRDSDAGSNALHDFLPQRPLLAYETSHFASVHAAAPSPFLASEVAFISGVNANGTLPLDAFSAWNSDTPATYGGGYTNTAKWGASSAGTAGGTISYYFNPASHWSATEEKMMAAGLTLWSDVANISFVQTTNAAQAEITFTRGSDGQADTSPEVTGSSNAGKTGGSTLLTMTGATVSIDTSVRGFGPITNNFTTDGGYPIMTFLHEEGHALGLGHAGPYNGNVDDTSQQFSAYDTRLWSIMSYIEPQSTTAKYYSQYPVTGTSWNGSDPTGLMQLDVLAAQALYGKATSTPLSGGQTFGFHCNVAGASEMFFDFTQNTNPILTLWDEGTGNTLDLSGYGTASTVNLTAGDFSSCDGMINNLSIASDTKIDTTITGAGNDTITANNDGDIIKSGAGNDTITGGTAKDKLYAGTGDDIVSGGGGNDLISFTGGQLIAADTINGGAGTDELYLGGMSYTGANALVFDSTTVRKIETIKLGAGNSYNITTADTTVASGATLKVNASALTSGHHLVFNGSAETNGHFVIEGGLGADTLTGGSQSDTFVYATATQSSSTKYDTINAFNFANDKFDVTETISQIDAAASHKISTSAFDTDIAAAASASHLAAHSAMLVTVSSGTLKGDVFLVIDENGTAGYQAGSDLVIHLHDATGTLATSDFI